MKRFTFALAPVLEHRRRIEDEKQRILADRRRRLSAAQDELARLHAAFKQYSNALSDDHQRLTSNDLRAHYAHLEYLDRCITMQHALIAQCAIAVDCARADVIEAGKERKAIEKVKDKRFEQHRVREAAIEQRETRRCEQ